MADEVAVAAVSLVVALLSKRRRQRKARKVWVKPYLLKRESDGAFHRLVQDLEKEPLEYKCYFRLTHEVFLELEEKVRPYLQKTDTRMRNAISPAEQLAVTLRFLATGESYSSLQYQFRINKGTLSLLIPNVCVAISTVLAEHILCPSTEQEWAAISEKFQDRWQLPNCLGAIDGKHIRILHPYRSGSDYYNYKGFYSIVLMAVVGPQANFIFCDVGCQGRISDGGVLRNTEFYKALQNNKLNIPPPKTLPMEDADLDDCSPIPHYFVGDDAFSLSEYIMKPYPNRGLTEEHRIFNYRLSRARRISENAFGILAAKFRVFFTTLWVNPESAVSIVHACLALHNFLLCNHSALYAPPGTMDVVTGDGDVQTPGTWRSEGESTIKDMQVPGMNYARSASHIRDSLCEYVNGPGQVPWQWRTLLP